jgi:Domain of unknown function (DUF4157)
MEERLGHDFSRVRVHADEEAGASARDLGAAAYTLGSDIVFAPDRYEPSRPEGRQLLVHELAHVVQQGISGSPTTARAVDSPTSAAEREAVAVSEVAMRGEHARPTIRSGAGLQLQPDAGASAAPTPAPTWDQQVIAAKAESDQAKKLAAMAQLVQQAVGKTTTVHTVPLGKTLDPADLKAIPAVNVDLNLNKKQSWPTTKGAPTRQLTRNYGYAFNKGADLYVVLGPNALDARSPIFTEMYVQHELFHAAHHLTSKPAKGEQARSDADEELEAWTNDFTNYFERLFQSRQQWAPLLDYYEKATAAARKTSLASIVAFYRAVDPRVQAAVDRWLKRRQADPNHASLELVKNLAAAFTPPAKTPAPAPTP